MASIRIPFPENDQPSSVKLQGSRITIGRLPFNTVQIIDRTISGFHAELILDAGHYRLHDRGSTNGTFVNGELTTDFHLREPCRISFGSVECDFDPAVDEAGAGDDSVPTRGEISAVRLENAELRTMLAAVREEVSALADAKPGDQPEQVVSRSEFAKVLAEREALKQSQIGLEKEIARLKGEFAILRRDRDNLQKAWESAKAELAKARPNVETVAFVEVPGVAKTPAPAAPGAVPVARPAPVSAPAAPPSLPSRPTVPLMKPSVPMGAPTGSPFPAPKPVAQPSRLVSAPTVVSKVPVANSSGVRPFPKAPTVAPGGPSRPTAPPPAGALPKPAPGVMHPRTAVMPVHAPAEGPKGTQKLA